MCKYDLFPPSAAFFLITSQFYEIIVFMTRCPEEGKHICLIAAKISWRMEVQQARILCFIAKSKFQKVFLDPAPYPRSHSTRSGPVWCV